MSSKGLVAVLMVVIAILFAVVGYVFAYSGLFNAAGIDTQFIFLIAIGCWISSLVIGILGVILGLFRFAKWAITD